jgi:amino acid adenylation domain-containing protein
MHQLFEEQVLRSSESAAVIDRDGVTQWTYEELNKHSNRLAGLLRKRGLKPGGLIAVIMDRSIHMVAAVMGILKAGGAYVPLEPYLPDERIRKLLESLHIETIIVNEAQLLKVNRISQPLPGLTHLVCPDKNPAVELETDLFTGKELIGPVELAQENVKNPAPAAKSGDISYIIFTSGSTGTPKGVVETHRPVINVIEWVNKTFGVGYPDKLLFVASLGFDLSVYDIFGILASGACLRVVGAEDIKDPGKLLDIIMIERITFWDSAPAALQQLAPFLPEVASYAEPGRLRLVFLSGDWIPVSMPDALREAFEGVRVISLGGATEATVWSNYYPIGEVDPSWPSIPYGKPIQNAKYYILDRNLEVCPLRVPGDLYIGGECLAVEYINDTALSAHKFIANPFENGEKIYRTGDIARWFEDGNMQFLGRKDQQVKIRGYRIELGEIESQLTSHPQVSDGIVLDRVDGTGNKYLCAYYVSKVKGEEIDREELKEYLLRELPEYMIPAYFIAIEKIPLTANGKLDRKGLPEPEASSESGVEFMAPENETQAKLVEVWAQVLGVEKEKIGITADFFQLGGHSLNATMVISRIHKEFNVKVPLAEIFNSPTIRELSRKIKTSESEIYAAIESVEKKEYYRLSSAQRRLYFLQQMEPGNTGYNIQEGVLLEGDVDIPVLEETFRKLIQRHESLRTSFEIVNDETVQRVHDNVEFKIEYYGGAAKNVKGPEENQSFIRAFDLSEAPLLRVGLSRLEEKKHVLLVDMHHIISDGVSHAVLKGDFGILFSGGQLPPIRLQYKDFSEWQHSEKQQELVGKQRAYWLNELSGDIPVLDIPTDYPRPMIQGYEGNTLEFDLGHEETALLNQLGREEKATLYMVLVAIYNVLLFKLGNQEEIIIGTPTAGRRHPDLERIMGMFVNTLVLKNYPIGEKPFTNFLQEVKEKTIKAFENQDYPFEELVERLVIKRDASRNPLFDVLFVLQNMAVETEGTSGASTGDSKVRLQPYRYSAAISKFDLTLSAVESGTGIHFSFEYCTRLFKEETIQRVIEYFKRIVSVVTGAKSKTLAGIEILSDEEKNLLLFEFNDTAAEYPRDKTIHGLFAEQVERTPDRIGLVGDVRHVGHVGLTYQKLNQQSGQLAQLLIEKGVLAGHIVAIMVERSIELIIGIFGILKAGGAYLPIDPEYPQERIDYMLEDSNALVLIDEKFFKGSKAPRRGEPIKVIQKSPPASANLAYIIYTSGSTGNPKGVMIEHHSVVNRLHWMQKCYPIGAGDVLLQKTPTVFDVSVWELFWWAMEGASLRLLGVGEEKNPEAIIDAIARSRVTAMHFVPSMLQVFLDYCEGSADMTMLSSLRQVFASGEALNVHQVEKFIQLLNEKNGTRLINLYGPTEATVDVSYYDCTPGQDVMDIPIGRPIDNIGLYVVDKNLNLQPVGVKGELCISGVGLARGYLNNPELAAEKFTKFNRSNKSNRTYTIYRTGDLARLLGNGQVEYLGRIDHQVKIRGFRVELGEIENQLLGNEKIKGAVVLLKDQHLYAYIAVKGEGEFNSSILRSYLSDKLPAYMIPSSFVQVEEIPLTANGKVDRKALDRTGKKLASDAAYIAPQNELEKKIAEVWKEVLHLERVGIHDNYFELGGTSFDIVKINRKLKELFQIEVPLVVMFRHTTVHGFAAYLNKESGDIHDRAAALERGKRDKRERLQRRKGAGTHPPIQKVEIV